MKQIKRITLINFQCHKRTEVVPSPSGLTVITGPTDYGKSAIVRGLKWLFNNRPQGDDFIRHGANECKVSVELVNGIVVVRRRTSSLNQYILNGDIYEGFGNNVPLEVQQALGIYSYEIAGKMLRLNIAEQLSGPFLGSSITAPTRAKILGKLAGTEVIDRANKQIGTDIYHAGQDKKKLKKEIKEKNDEIESYNWVPVLGATLKKAEEKFKQVKKDKERLERLQKLQNELANIQKKKKLINGKLFMLSRTGQAELKLNTIDQDKQFHDTIKTYAEKWAQLIRQKANIKEGLSCLENAGKAIESIDLIVENVKDYNILDDIKAGLNDTNNFKTELFSKLSKLQQVSQANETLQSALTKVHLLEQIDRIHDKLHEQFQARQWIKEDLKQVEIIDHVKKIIDSIEHDHNELSDYQEQLITMKHINKNLKKYKEVKKDKEQKIKQVNQIAVQSREKYKSLLDKMGICPTCGANMVERKLEKVI